MRLFPSLTRLMLFFWVALSGISTVHAKGEPVVLSIYGPVAAGAAQATDSANKGKASGPLLAAFDMKFLKSLPQRTFQSKTPWYKDSVTFTGPLLRDVLAAAKAKGEWMHAVALDEYQAKIPFSDAQEYDVILAHQINGETLTPKNKGPLFVVYPYDSKPELQSVRFYERSIWQLKALRIE